jgi:hypothetical protein
MKLLIDDTTGEVALVPPGLTLSPLPGQTLRDATAPELELIASNQLMRIINGELTVVPPPVPHEVAAWRARAVLDAAGLLSGVVAAIEGLAEPMRSHALAAWHGMAPVSRDSATVEAAREALSLTAAQTDDLFRAAAAITV